MSGSQTAGAAILSNYRFSNARSDVFSLPLRFEYIGQAARVIPMPQISYTVRAVQPGLQPFTITAKLPA